MKVRIIPSNAKGTIQAPPSKSMAHRYLICAALATGASVVNNIDLSEDVKATIACLKALGVEARYEDSKVYIESEGIKYCKDSVLNCNESGSTLRFMIPLCLMLGEEKKLVGTEKLLSRPLSVYENICKDINADFRNDGSSILVNGKLTPGTYNLPGNISSQFITGLMYVFPLLEEDTLIHMTTEVESRSYINMTMQVLKEFGVDSFWEGDDTIRIPGNQKYCAGEYVVEGDYSNAAFLDAFNLIGGDVTTTGLKEVTLQGDSIYKKYYKLLKEENPVLDLTDCPDLGPILMSLAACLNGAEFTGTKRLEIKESNRGIAMKEELEKLGAKVTVNDNTIKVDKVKLQKPMEIINGHNDHRIVMAMATALTLTGGEIDGAEAVRKSFPDYFERIMKIGIEVETDGMD